MRAADQPLAWTEGPRRKGCTYHKCARFGLDEDTIQIDVFVMPSIAEARPIAITVGRYQEYQPVRKVKKAIRSTYEWIEVLPKVTQALVTVGCSEDIASERASDVGILIQREVVAINAALRRADAL